MKVYLTGFMGSGKTFLGKQLAQKLNFAFVDMDEMIAQYAQLSVPDIFHQHGEDYFRRTEHLVLKNTEILHNTVIATGGGTPCFFNHMNWMNQRGTTIFINPDSTLIFQRLLPEKHLRPLIHNIQENELQKWIDNKLSERLHHYSKAHFQTESQDIDVFLDIVNNMI